MGGVTAIYSADKTTHVIEYGIQHDAIRASRANTKAIKDKIRKKREEEKKKEQEALKKHKEAMDRLKNLKSTTSKTNIDSNDTLEFGMSDAVKQKRAEIKAIKEKRRKSKLHSSVSSSPSLKPSKLSKEKSLEKKRKPKVVKEEKLKNVAPTKRRSIKLDDNSIFASLKEENGELKKQLKMSEFIKKKYEILKNENILYKEQVTVLNEENETLKMQLNELQTKLDKMKANEKKLSNGYHQKEKIEKIENVMDENDESDDNVEEEVQKNTDGDVENEEVEDEVIDAKNVEKEQNEQSENEEDDDKDEQDMDGGSSSNSSDENEWEEWESDQICDWVLSIDAKYKKYEKAMRKNTKNEEIHGSILDALQEDDFERFGVSSAKHRKNIMIALKKLVGDTD